MDLEDSDILDDGDGKLYSSVSCSICLDAVTDNGDRSWAKLQCGHQFHLDCIGSAFNIKGVMQCPNCRKIEKGQWLYANSSRPFPEFSMEDWTHDEDLYDLGYSEMFFGVHWCPFSGLTRLQSIDEGEFSSTAYHDLLGQHAIFAEHTAVSSASHPCPYVAYFRPVHPSSSNSSRIGPESSNFSSHWNGPSLPAEIQTSYAFPAIDLHYHSWEHHSTPFSTSSNRIIGGGGDQPPIPSVSQRSGRANPDIPRSGSMYPFLVGHSSGARAGSSVASSMIPPYPGSNARARDRVQALQAYYQQRQPSNSPAIRTPMISGSRRSGHRGLAQVAPVVPSSDQTSGFYFFPSGASSLNFQEGENPQSTHVPPWEVEYSPSFPFNVVGRDPSLGAFHQHAGGSDSGIRPRSYRQRHGSERTQSQNRS